MYERYYGLRERPFELTPNPKYLLLTDQHKEALSILQYGIRERKGITVVLGPAGTGKTTLIRAALALFSDGRTRCVCLNNPTVTRDELIEMLANAFELGDEAARSKAVLLAKLEASLLERRAQGVVTALIVDEAQALPDDCLEEIRLLLNLESETEKLLPVVLVGQAELSHRLNQPAHAALKQRVALRCDLQPLKASDTAHYIATRIRTAGGVPRDLFTREAVDLIHERSGGIPRTISVVCDNALVTGFALEQRPVGRQLILEVCQDFDLLQSPESLPAPAPRHEAPAVPAIRVAEEARPEPAAGLDEVAATTAPSRSAAGLFGMFERSDRPWFSR